MPRASTGRATSCGGGIINLLDPFPAICRETDFGQWQANHGAQAAKGGMGAKATSGGMCWGVGGVGLVRFVHIYIW